MYSWDDLKHLLAFARTGSILAAAKTLGVNHSTVQRRLADLESRLGDRLIERDLTGYRLTVLGQDLVPLAERVEQAATALERHRASREPGLAGTVRVTCGPTVGQRLERTSLIHDFETRFRGLRVELLMGDRFFDLAKGEADIAIRARAGEPEDEALVGRKIADLNWAVYASRSYIERHGRPDRLEDIEKHRVVHSNGVMANHAATRWLRSVAPNAKVSAYSESWPGLVMVVKSGAGLSPLPVVQGENEADLVRIIDIPGMLNHIYLLMHRDMQRTPRVRAFFDYVVTEIKAFRVALAGRSGGPNA
jgi:DNA-binding transcriptional LysR family regulator